MTVELLTPSEYAGLINAASMALEEARDRLRETLPADRPLLLLLRRKIEHATDQVDP